ncbi:hypothetical protein [Aidingimonas halophila]|uniref:Uncharacterized protein n=1 Tax=Aidingimonas halophila TaxID=574349 RepID=A0A1H2Y2X8_9GAMM|nr:hypothetical protein [Aidingimonas halophila]GHC34310.1 hypothetical protein GCM10008094_29030 [Aidingimonas halophila]SDW98939.1 hypothetical protein SAMN05443545_103344 [Aidingimonas halophila]
MSCRYRPWGLAGLLSIWLSACATSPDQPTDLRQALLGLSERASEAVLEDPVWSRPTQDIVLLLAEPDIDNTLSLDTERFTETLTRALLGRSEGPQVLNWQPLMAETELPDNQWLLASRLEADGPPLKLSDRELLPYRLTVELKRPGESDPRWSREFSGAFDATAL